MEKAPRLLTPEDIEVRVQSVKKTNNGTGAILLLYKNARVDMAILDEWVGPMNWQRKHTRENANCIISIWDEDKKQWVDKEDTGTESKTEAEKGQASDSFKRAGFNWGIGRELYTSPFIWVDLYDSELYNDKLSAYVKFHVDAITYDDNRRITSLIVKDQKQNVRYSLGGKKPVSKPTTKSKATPKKEETPKEENLLSREMVFAEAYQKGMDKAEVTNLWQTIFGAKADSKNQEQIQTMLDEIDKIDEFAGTPLE